MSTQDISGLGSFRKRWNDRVISILTVMLFLLMFVFTPLQAADMAAFQVPGFAAALVLIGGLFFVSASPLIAAATLAAFPMAVWAAFARLTAPSSRDIFLIAGAWLIMAMALRVRFKTSSWITELS